MDDEPKLRHIKLDFMLLAYLGDFLKNIEQGVEQQARDILKSQSTSNIRTHQEQNPGGQ